mmetsp:Transcript_38111/g.109594  ORF Transcript_38111/g.109594 Transcript_38111/m.109594 type:complete len:256 (-) Transcript_38111:942-1709(-)
MSDQPCRGPATARGGCGQHHGPCGRPDRELVHRELRLLRRLRGVPGPRRSRARGPLHGGGRRRAVVDLQRAGPIVAPATRRRRPHATRRQRPAGLRVAVDGGRGLRCHAVRRPSSRLRSGHPQGLLRAEVFLTPPRLECLPKGCDARVAEDHVKEQQYPPCRHRGMQEAAEQGADQQRGAHHQHKVVVDEWPAPRWVPLFEVVQQRRGGTTGEQSLGERGGLPQVEVQHEAQQGNEQGAPADAHVHGQAADQQKQ